VGSGPFWVAITPDAGTVDFDSFTIKKARVKLHKDDDEEGEDDEGEGEKKDKDKFEVKGSFVLGNDSNGIGVHGEIVTVVFGDLPPFIIDGNKFVQKDDKYKFKFKGGSPGITKIKIELKKNGEFKFEVKAKDLDLGSIDLINPINPVFFSVQIGDYLGETDIPFDKKGRFRE